MRAIALLSLALALILPGSVMAQSSPPFYINKEYRFAIIFPKEPEARDIVYTTASGLSLPAREFFAVADGNRHVITVADASSGPAVDIALVDRIADELRGRGEVRFQASEDYDPGLPGRQLNIFQPDGRQLRASVYMWDHRLYITEAEGAPGVLSLLRFEQSVTLLDPDGNELNLDADVFERRREGNGN